jgi:aldehyde dehydrogenase (NAD+)
VSKFFNAGQTCLAPDYALVQQSIANSFVQHCRDLETRLFEPARQPRIVTAQHFSRLEGLMKDAVDSGAKVEFTGVLDHAGLIFPPTLLSNISLQSELMKEEIFGPILPVVTYDTIDDAIGIVNGLPKPLGLYLFTTSVRERVLVQKQTSSGGMCVNDAAIHFLHPDLPFGGVNNSGIGKAHGFSGFLAFSNEKPVLRQRRGTSMASLLYPPYGKRQEQIIRTIFRLLYR